MPTQDQQLVEVFVSKVHGIANTAFGARGPRRYRVSADNNALRAGSQTPQWRASLEQQEQIKQRAKSKGSTVENVGPRCRCKAPTVMVKDKRVTGQWVCRCWSAASMVGGYQFADAMKMNMRPPNPARSMGLPVMLSRT